MSTLIGSLQISLEQQRDFEELEAQQEIVRREKARFVRGPIQAKWLEKAARLPGKALHAAIAIHYLDGFKRTGKVKLRPSVRNSYGMDRHSCSRALKELEEAGLISVDRKPGSAPAVTIQSLEHRTNPSVQ